MSRKKAVVLVNDINRYMIFLYGLKGKDFAKLDEYIYDHKKMKYNYDFGDNWQHYVEVERYLDDYDKNYPVCTEGEGNTPPEDVGGEYGYEEFLKIISDKSHPENDSMTSWGKSQGYKEFNIEDANRMIKLR